MPLVRAPQTAPSTVLDRSEICDFSLSWFAGVCRNFKLEWGELLRNQVKGFLAISPCHTPGLNNPSPIPYQWILAWWGFWGYDKERVDEKKYVKEVLKKAFVFSWGVLPKWQKVVWQDIGCSLNDLLPTVPPIFTCFCLKTLPSLGPISFFWPKFVNCLVTVCCQARVVFIFLVSAFMSHPSSDALLLNWCWLNLSNAFLLPAPAQPLWIPLPSTC